MSSFPVNKYDTGEDLDLIEQEWHYFPVVLSDNLGTFMYYDLKVTVSGEMADYYLA